MNRDEMDDKLERDLRTALRRIDAAPGFADRVAARLRNEETNRQSAWWTGLLQVMRAPAFAITVVAVLFVGLVIGVEHRRSEERRQAESAKQQLMVAMRITGAKLQTAKQKVNEINSHRRQELQTRMEN